MKKLAMKKTAKKPVAKKSSKALQKAAPEVVNWAHEELFFQAAEVLNAATVRIEALEELLALETSMREDVEKENRKLSTWLDFANDDADRFWHAARSARGMLKVVCRERDDAYRDNTWFRKSNQKLRSQWNFFMTEDESGPKWDFDVWDGKFTKPSLWTRFSRWWTKLCASGDE